MWEIPLGKVSAVLTDNGSNMIAAYCNFRVHIQESGDESDDDEVQKCDEESDFEYDELEDECDDFQLREQQHEIAFSIVGRRVACFAHTFNKEKGFKKVIISAHRMVKRVNKSTKATERLISPCGEKLVADCPTRWSSTFLMIERMLQVRTSLIQVLKEQEWDALAHSEWKSLESVHDLLKPFAQYTALLGGEEYSTISSVIPVLMELTLHLKEVGVNCVWWSNTLWASLTTSVVPFVCAKFKSTTS